MGIPLTFAEVDLYTNDNRWTGGHGVYIYDYRVYGVGSQERS